MGSFSIWHWAIVLAVLMLIFGGKPISNLLGDIGGGLREFKKGMRELTTTETEVKRVASDVQDKARTS